MLLRGENGVMPPPAPGVEGAVGAISTEYTPEPELEEAHALPLPMLDRSSISPRVSALS